MINPPSALKVLIILDLKFTNVHNSKVDVEGP
jgi:hypothetical protein